MKTGIWKKLTGILLILAMVISVATGCNSGAAERIDESTALSIVENVADAVDELDAKTDSEGEIVADPEGDTEEDTQTIDQDGSYTSKEDVALYLTPTANCRLTSSLRRKPRHSDG